MNWLQEYAKIKVVEFYIALGVLALCLLAFIILALVKIIPLVYKKHSKKYVYDCVRNEYVKKEIAIKEGWHKEKKSRKEK